MSTIRRHILDGLRHGPLNTYILADAIDEAPFRVRVELKAMKRDRLVRDRHSDTYTWELTEIGTTELYRTDQTELLT